jgi:hypothetical protein
MPAINFNYIEKIIKYFNCKNDFRIFVETGTWRGNTILGMEPYFENLHTIEIKEDLYNNVKNLYNGNKINFILGDSSFELEKLCKTLEDNTIFFLDGHWSGGNTGRGIKDCPLYEELSSINKYFKNTGIIIIDDMRLFEIDWKEMNVDNVLKILQDRIISYTFMESNIIENDRLIIYIKNI